MGYLVNPATDKLKGEFAFHGLKRDEEGLLTYTKVYANSDESVQLNGGEELLYGGFDSMLAKDNAIPDNNELFEQFRFDENELWYYINEDGFLVARYFKPINYQEIQ